MLDTIQQRPHHLILEKFQNGFVTLQHWVDWQTANAVACHNQERTLCILCASNTFPPNITIAGWCCWKIVEGKMQNYHQISAESCFCCCCCFLQLLLFMGPKIFMCIVAIALIHTCTQIKIFSFIFCTSCPLLLKLRWNHPPVWLLHTGVSERETCICTRFGVKAFEISVS